jgi:hypothetical protein
MRYPDYFSASRRPELPAAIRNSENQPAFIGQLPFFR